MAKAKATAPAKTKLYKAQRDRLRTHGGEIHAGEAYPAAEVTPSLLGIGWVTEGLGSAPVDDRTHAAFAAGELDRHEPADPAAVKAFKKAQADAEEAEAARAAAAAATAAAPTPAPAAPAKVAKGKKPAAPAVESGTALPKAKRASKKGK